jgi:hypothetical protein
MDNFRQALDALAASHLDGAVCPWSSPSKRQHPLQRLKRRARPTPSASAAALDPDVRRSRAIPSRIVPIARLNASDHRGCDSSLGGPPSRHRQVR